MSRLHPSAGLAVVMILLAGCDTGPSMQLVNGLNEPVVLHLGPEGSPPKDIELSPGQSKTFDGRDTKRGRYAISVGGCALVFLYPSVSGLNYPWFVSDGKGGTVPDYRYPFPLAQELRADLRVHLVEAQSKKMRTESAPGEEGHGFPLGAIAKTCGR